MPVFISYLVPLLLVLSAVGPGLVAGKLVHKPPDRPLRSTTASTESQPSQVTKSTETQSTKSAGKENVAPAQGASQGSKSAASNSHKNSPSPSLTTSASAQSNSSHGMSTSHDTSRSHSPANNTGAPPDGGIIDPMLAHLDRTKAKHAAGIPGSPGFNQEHRANSYINYRDAKESTKNMHRALYGKAKRPDPNNSALERPPNSKEPYDPADPRTKVVLHNKGNYHMARNDQKADEARKKRGEKPLKTDGAHAKAIMGARDSVFRAKRQIRDPEQPKKEAPKKNLTKGQQAKVNQKIDNAQLEGMRLKLAKQGMGTPNSKKLSSLGDVSSFEEYKRFAKGEDRAFLERMEKKNIQSNKDWRQKTEELDEKRRQRAQQVWEAKQKRLRASMADARPPPSAAEPRSHPRDPFRPDLRQGASLQYVSPGAAPPGLQPRPPGILRSSQERYEQAFRPLQIADNVAPRPDPRLPIQGHQPPIAAAHRQFPAMSPTPDAPAAPSAPPPPPSRRGMGLMTRRPQAAAQQSNQGALTPDQRKQQIKEGKRTAGLSDEPNEEKRRRAIKQGKRVAFSSENAPLGGHQREEWEVNPSDYQRVFGGHEQPAGADGQGPSHPGALRGYASTDSDSDSYETRRRKYWDPR